MSRRNWLNLNLIVPMRICSISMCLNVKCSTGSVSDDMIHTIKQFKWWGHILHIEFKPTTTIKSIFKMHALCIPLCSTSTTQITKPYEIVHTQIFKSRNTHTHTHHVSEVILNHLQICGPIFLLKDQRQALRH